VPTKTVARIQGVEHGVVTCTRCGATMQVSVETFAVADVTYIDRRDDMEAAAQPALQSDARRTRRLVRCSGCKRRSTGWLALEIARSSAGLVAAVGLFVFAPDREDIVWFVIIALALYGAISMVLLRRRLRNADACVIMLAPPKPKPRPERRAALPRAVAVSAPALKPAAPIPVTPPPPIATAQPPPAPGDEPSILTTKD
jgi:hypothetical protein